MSTFINNRYKIIKQLGQGGMATVYQVQDTLHNNQVLALKQIQAHLVGSRNLTQFKYEFTVLKSLHHPNLINVYDFYLSTDNKDCYFTMEYIPGHDLSALANSYRNHPTTSTDYTWLYKIIVQICRVLQYIHAKGLIHYDIKPSNIRLTTNNQVKLMDFGLIGKANDDIQLSGRGTPDYMAPELIRGHQIDHRVDFYALGVTLYQIVSGYLPFSGNNSSSILKHHLETTPHPPQNLRNTVPPKLQQLILTLLAKEPLHRANSANQIIQSINSISKLNFPLETKETKRSYIQSGQFVGRNVEFEHLQNILMRTDRNQGRLVLISGAAGVGKTRLVNKLKLHAQLEHILTFEGFCRSRTRTPYQPWIPILNQIISYQQQHQPDSLQVHATLLAKLMSGLGLTSQSLPTLSPIASEKSTLLEATAKLLQSCNRPLLIILEDLQYADSETLDLLDYLGKKAPQSKWLLCGLYRDDEIDTNHALQPLIHQAKLINPQRQINTPTRPQPYDQLYLAPFSTTDVATFVQSMLGVSQLPSGILSQLLDYSGGNARFIESLMYHFIEQNHLQHNEQGWQINLENLQDIPHSIKEAAQQSLARLNDSTLNLLQWAAIMGNRLDIEALVAVCNISPTDIISLLAQAKQHHVLEIQKQNKQSFYKFNNEHIRDALYQSLSTKERQKRHINCGEALQTLYDDSEIAELLTWHFTEGKDFIQSLKYAKLAADKAKNVYANRLAIDYYSQAIKLLQKQPKLATPETHYAILEGRQACYHIIGSLDDEQQDLNKMVELAKLMGNTAKQIMVRLQQADIYRQQGDNKNARPLAQQALSMSQQAQDQKLEADSLHAIGLIARDQENIQEAETYFEQALSLYRSLNNQTGQATCLRWLGWFYIQTGRSNQAKSLLEEALATFQDLGDQHNKSAVFNSLAVLSQDYAEKRRYQEKALALAESTGHTIAQIVCINNLSLLYWAFGLYTQAKDYVNKAINIAQSKGLKTQVAYFLDSLGRIELYAGDYANAQNTIQKSLNLAKDLGNPLHRALALFMMGRVALARNQLNPARELFEKAYQSLKPLGRPGELATLLTWLANCWLAMDNWQAALHHSQQALKQLKNSNGTAGDYPVQDIWWIHYQILKANPKHQANSPIDNETWDTLQQARRSMLASIATLSDEGLRRNYLNKVAINHQIITEWIKQAKLKGYTDAELAEATTALNVDPTALSTAQVEERLKRVLNISRRMSEMNEAGPLLEYTMDQVIELTGAERSFLVFIDETGRPEFKVTRGIRLEELEETRNQISYSIIGTVAQTLSPLLLQDALTNERFSRQSSILDLNLRSVLCVPLISRGQLIGVIYLDNRAASGRFTQSDVDLMTIFASQAAIAIENARLYNKLEDWAQTLELRVEQRTTQLKEANQAIYRHVVQLETSNTVGQHITSLLEMEELLTEVVKLLQDRFDYYFVGVWLLNRQKDNLVLQTFAGGPADDNLKSGISLSMKTESLAVEATSTGYMQLSDNIQQEENTLALGSNSKAQSELALPLHQGGTVMGTLHIQSDKIAAFQTEDLMVLENMANQISIAINNAQLYQSEQSRRHLAESLVRTARALTSTLDMNQMPGLILDELALVAPYQRGSLLVQNGNMLQALARRGFPEDNKHSSMQIPIKEGDIYQQMVNSQQHLIIDDIREATGWQQLSWLPENRSWLGVPLIIKDKVIGFFSLTRLEVAAFNPDEGDLVQAFAGQAAIALENARLYAEIAELNTDLDRQVQERTAELNMAYHNLERLDKAKSDFIQVTAHELRTPLTLIDGYTQMLHYDKGVNSSKDAQEILQDILNGTQRMLEIINSSLDVTKIDSDALKLRKISLQFDEVLMPIQEGLIKALKKRDLTLNIHNLENLPSIEADHGLLTKAFSHLLLNAIKYTPNGGQIDINTMVIEEENKNNHPSTWLQIAISDTGIGINPDDLALIFEKFYQTGEVALHSSSKTAYKGGGPGLGLAIVKGIITAHQGHVWAESKGHDEENYPGSIFYVRLPVAK